MQIEGREGERAKATERQQQKREKHTLARIEGKWVGERMKNRRGGGKEKRQICYFSVCFYKSSMFRNLSKKCWVTPFWVPLCSRLLSVLHSGSSQACLEDGKTSCSLLLLVFWQFWSCATVLKEKKKKLFHSVSSSHFRYFSEILQRFFTDRCSSSTRTSYFSFSYSPLSPFSCVIAQTSRQRSIENRENAFTQLQVHF